MTTLVTDGRLLKTIVPCSALESIMEFLNGGKTGTVELNIKDGEIRTVKIVEAIVIPMPRERINANR